MFNEFIERKESAKFNDDIVEFSKNYAEVSEIGDDDGEKMFKLVINPDANKTICFVAGLHGDEKGGPYGVLEFIKSKFYVPKRKKVVILPLVNHNGFNRDKRRNANGVDINRQFSESVEGQAKNVWDAIKDENMIILHTLHEDPRLKSWYCYHTNLYDIAKELRTLAKEYFPIFSKSRREPLAADEKEGHLWGDKIYDGLIPLPHTKSDCLEDKVWIEEGIPYIVTETPGKDSIKKRAEYNKNAMKLIINAL